jgi:hypothetical protein
LKKKKKSKKKLKKSKKKNKKTKKNFSKTKRLKNKVIYMYLDSLFFISFFQDLFIYDFLIKICKNKKLT